MKCCRSLAWPRWQGAPLLPVHWYGKEAQHRQRGHARLLAMLIQALMCSSAVSVVKRLRVKLSTRVWGSSAAFGFGEHGAWSNPGGGRFGGVQRRCFLGLGEGTAFPHLP